MNTEELADELAGEYIKSPYHCPFCKDGNIVGDSMDVGEGGAMQDVHCDACGKAWTDHYSITGVEFQQEDLEEILKNRQEETT